MFLFLNVSEEERQTGRRRGGGGKGERDRKREEVGRWGDEERGRGGEGEGERIVPVKSPAPWSLQASTTRLLSMYTRTPSSEFAMNVCCPVIILVLSFLFPYFLLSSSLLSPYLIT
jgi:hypothetical protein